MAEPIPSKKELVGLVEAQAASIDSISERLVMIESSVEKQDSKNQNVIYAVLIAFILIIGTVAVEVMLSGKNDREFDSNLQKDIHEQNLKINNLENTIENLKVRNSYLK